MTADKPQHFVLLEGGIVQNDPSVPVFDLDTLEDEIKGDHSGVEDLYGRLLDFAADAYCDPVRLESLPPTLAGALRSTEKEVAEQAQVPLEIVALARQDSELREELFAHAGYSGSLGERTGQELARLVLATGGGQQPDPEGRIMLTDLEPRRDGADLYVTSSQLEHAAEQYLATTGEKIDADAIINALDQE